MKQRISNLKIRPSDGNWYVRIGGKARWAPKRVKTVEEADLWRAGLCLSLNAHDSPEKSNDDVPLADLVDKYVLDHKKEWNAATLAKRQAIFTEFKAKFGGSTVRTLLPGNIVDWMNAHDKWGPSYRNLIVAQIRAFFSHCQKMYGVTQNHGSRLEKPKMRLRGKEAILSEENYRKLHGAMDPHYKALLTVCWESGSRPSEILSLTGKEYLPEDRMIDKGLNNKMGHEAKSRQILLVGEAETLVKEAVARKGDGLLFPGKKGKQIKPSGWRDIMVRAAKRAGLEALHVFPYMFRHSLSNRLARKGVPLAAIATILGNTVQVCERHYCHLKDCLKDFRKHLE